MGKAKRRKDPGSKPGTPARGVARDANRATLPTWTRWAALAVLMGVHAFLLAGVFNPAPHSGGDNAGYLTLAYSLLDRGEYLDLYDPAEPAHTKYPPGFPLVLAGAMLLGARSWAQLKVLSGLAIFATVGLSVAWAWRRKGWELAVAVGALLAFAHAFLYASQWILSDPMFLVLTMLALLAFDRFDALPQAHPGAAEEGPPPSTDSDAKPRTLGGATAWLALGIAATVAAFFTRSAGLPLVVAVGLWLLWRRRFAAAGAFSVALGVPAVLWWLRDRVLGGPGYTGEFWLINPYQPDLGRAGLGDLVGRVVTNATQYVGAHIPTGFVGVRGGPVATLGVALLVLALVGWFRRMRTPSVAELFAPLYLGLILLWPEVWSGDRFALPLFPLLVFYAGDALVDVTRGLPKAGRVAVLSLAMAMMLVPSALTWRQSARQSENCQIRAARDAFACYGPRMQEFVAAAKWTQDNLDEEAVVFSRKPRMFYVVSGTASQVFPLSAEPEVLLAAADSAQARYVVIDHLDNLAGFYLIPILQQRPEVFCTVQSFGGDSRGIATELLGFRAERPAAVDVAEGEAGTVSLTLSRCPQDMLRAPSGQPPSSSDPRVVPLLTGLDS